MRLSKGSIISLVTVGLILAGLCQLCCAYTPTFQGLEDLPGGIVSGNATDVGSMMNEGPVVGQGRSAGNEACIWYYYEGFDPPHGLGDLPGGMFESKACGVSGGYHGSVVVGYGYQELGKEAFRWTSGSGMTGLGDLTGGGFESVAYAVSTDGLVIVGYGSSVSGTEAFRWTESTGMVGLLTCLEGPSIARPQLSQPMPGSFSE